MYLEQSTYSIMLTSFPSIYKIGKNAQYCIIGPLKLYGKLGVSRPVKRIAIYLTEVGVKQCGLRDTFFHQIALT